MELIKIVKDATISFEQVFSFTPTGRLKTDPDTCKHVQEWWNNNRLLVSLIIGIDTYDVNFTYDKKENSRMMYNIYALSYAAYIKFCQQLSREQDVHMLNPDKIHIE